jgi:hypothetical protein
MPPFLEFFVITFTMLGAFAVAFLLLFLLALVLAPIERGLSDMIWSHQSPSASLPAKGSFKDFSKKY